MNGAALLAVAIGGATLAVGGVIWYFLSKPQAASLEDGTRYATRPPPKPSFVPVVGRSFAGVNVQGSF